MKCNRASLGLIGFFGLLCTTEAFGWQDALRAKATVLNGAGLERVDNRRLKIYPGTIGFADGSVRTTSAATIADIAMDLDTGPAIPVNDMHYAVFATADHGGTDFRITFSAAKAQPTASVAAGQAVNVPVADTTGFEAGQVVSIEASPTQMEMATVMTVGPSHLVLDEVKAVYPTATIRVRSGHRPQGFSSYRLLGWVYFFRGSLLRFRQVGDTVFYEEPTSFIEVTNGTATTYQPVDMFLPPTRSCVALVAGRIKLRALVWGEAHLLLSSNGLGISRDVIFGGNSISTIVPFQTETPAVGGVIWYRLTRPEHEVNLLISGYRCDRTEDWTY
ncbi:MAG: hypothetical protein RL885_29645 [Planctomycetota bacterium]